MDVPCTCWTGRETQTRAPCRTPRATMLVGCPGVQVARPVGQWAAGRPSVVFHPGKVVPGGRGVWEPEAPRTPYMGCQGSLPLRQGPPLLLSDTVGRHD